MSVFALDPRLAANTSALTRWPVSDLLLMNEQRYRWLLLVPRQADAAELTDLSEADSQTLMREIRSATRMLQTFSDTGKVNVAALGNQVRQLHVHVIARRQGDPAWPGVVWDKGPFQPMDEQALAARLEELRSVVPADV